MEKQKEGGPPSCGSPLLSAALEEASSKLKPGNKEKVPNPLFYFFALSHASLDFYFGETKVEILMKYISGQESRTVKSLYPPITELSV